MASKGLHKDSIGFAQLSQDDIEAIENGVPNYLYTKWPGILVRFHQAAMGLYMYKKSNYRDPSWSTLTERLDLWRASFIAFKQKPLLGWGTGSIHIAQEYGLSANQSALVGKAMKPHSQYLYILLTLGIIGLISCVLLYGYFVVKTGVYKMFHFNVFIIVFVINFIANNSFESQVGQNMFVLFSLIYWQFHSAGVPLRR
jgi:O-antigen ligase